MHRNTSFTESSAGCGVKLSHGGSSVQLPSQNRRPRSGSFDGAIHGTRQSSSSSLEQPTTNHTRDFDDLDGDDDDDEDCDEDDYEEDCDANQNLFGIRRARSNSVPNIHFGNSGS